MKADIATLDVLRDLNRVKVVFQARAIGAVMGLPLAMQTPKSNHQQGENNARAPTDTDQR